MTVKLYDERPYETRFAATVTSCEKADDKAGSGTRYGIVLDQTLFFPEEGGPAMVIRRMGVSVSWTGENSSYSSASFRRFAKWLSAELFLGAAALYFSTFLVDCATGVIVPAPATQPPGQAMPSKR